MLAARRNQTMHFHFNRTCSFRVVFVLFVTLFGLCLACNAQTATPDAPDQSELLKNSKDPDVILHNFKTMYVEIRSDNNFFDPTQMKAALYRNPDFATLNIHVVDDRRVADVVLSVGYTFAWDFPFELRHQNTTTVLLAGKGEGPFSGPLGAADVAKIFVNLAKPWRTAKQPTK